MRSYPRNSPQAAARIVALAMVSDGHLDRAELDTVNLEPWREALGLDPALVHAVMHTLCEDLLASAHGSWSDACRIDAQTLAELLAEIDDPDLRRNVLGLCAAVVESDGHVAEAESVVLVAAAEQWGLQRDMPRRETGHDGRTRGQPA